MDLLEQARESTGGEGLVFPAQRGKPLTDSTISKLVRENGIGCVPHGMRSSFRDWGAGCSDAPREIAEFALGHAEGSAAELDRPEENVDIRATQKYAERQNPRPHVWSIT